MWSLKEIAHKIMNDNSNGSLLCLSLFYWVAFVVEFWNNNELLRKQWSSRLLQRFSTILWLNEVHWASWQKHLRRLICTSLITLMLILFFRKTENSLKLHKFSHSLLHIAFRFIAWTCPAIPFCKNWPGW